MGHSDGRRGASDRPAVVAVAARLPTRLVPYMHPEAPLPASCSLHPPPLWVSSSTNSLNHGLRASSSPALRPVLELSGISNSSGAEIRTHGGFCARGRPLCRRIKTKSYRVRSEFCAPYHRLRVIFGLRLRPLSSLRTQFNPASLFSPHRPPSLGVADRSRREVNDGMKPRYTALRTKSKCAILHILHYLKNSPV